MRELKIDTCVYLRLQWHPALREGSSRGSILSLCRYPCFILDKSRSSLTRRYTRDALSAFFSPYFFSFLFQSSCYLQSRHRGLFCTNDFTVLGTHSRWKPDSRAAKVYMCLVTESIRSKSLHFGTRSLKSSMDIGF